MKWYYLPNINDDVLVVDGEEFRHLCLVMHARVGDSVVCFNGIGEVAECQITQIEKQRALLKVLKKETQKECSKELVLYAAAIKGERQEIMLRQATELGATRLVLFESERSEAKLKEQKRDKLQKQLVAACKQCHRAFLPKLEFCSWAQFIAQIKQSQMAVIMGSFLAEQGLVELKKNVFLGSCGVLVGPEGGFSQSEEQQLAEIESVHKVSLGKNVLRADTAACMLLSYVKSVKMW